MTSTGTINRSKSLGRAGQSYTDQSTQQVVIDFQHPHVLIAAATGEGKSLGVTVGPVSLWEHNGPESLVVHLIDLKNDNLMALQTWPQVDTCAGTEEAALTTLAKLDELKGRALRGRTKRCAMWSSLMN